MTYEDIEIRHLDDVLPHITEGITHRIKDGYSVIDYSHSTNETFSNPISLECRGLKFNLNGDLIARPFHKFFNIGEKESIDDIDWNLPHTTYEKLDGSMVHAVILDGELTFMTRGGISKQSKMAFEHASDELKDFCVRICGLHMTPIFEYTGPKNRIVIDYPREDLTLLAVRSIGHGSYLSNVILKKISMSNNIKFVNSVGKIKDSKSFVNKTRELVDKEGYVIEFDNGHRLKIKGDDYVLKHRTLGGMSSEKYVFNLVVDNKFDDIIPLLSGVLKEKFRVYGYSVMNHIILLGYKIRKFVEENENLSRKEFALKAKEEYDSRLLGVVFNLLNDTKQNVNYMLEDMLRKHMNGNVEKREKLKEIFPVYWDLSDDKENS